MILVTNHSHIWGISWSWRISRWISLCPHLLAWKNTDVNLLTALLRWLVSLDLECPCSIYFRVVDCVRKWIQTLLMLIRSPVHVASLQGIGWFLFCRDNSYSIPFWVALVLFSCNWMMCKRINSPPSWSLMSLYGRWYRYFVVLRLYYHNPSECHYIHKLS